MARIILECRWEPGMTPTPIQILADYPKTVEAMAFMLLHRPGEFDRLCQTCANNLSRRHLDCSVEQFLENLKQAARDYKLSKKLRRPI